MNDSEGEDNDSDNSDDDNNDDDNDGKPVTLADRILVKAKECLRIFPKHSYFNSAIEIASMEMPALKQQHQISNDNKYCKFI